MAASLILASNLAAAVFGAEELGAQSVQIRFGTFELAPYGFHDGENSRRGMLRDVNGAIAAKAGLSSNDVVMPLKRINKELQKGVIMCASFIPSAWSSKALTQVAEIYADFKSVVIPRKRLTVSRLEDLHERSIAIPRGAYTGFQITEDAKIRRHLTNGYDQSALLLKAGRVDAMVGSDIAVYHSLRQAGLAKSDAGAPFVFLKSTIWLQCQKNVDPALIERLRGAANSLRRDGVFDRLRIAYSSQFLE
jgi:ABC-type amino acid transport substrate-binding protein